MANNYACTTQNEPQERWSLADCLMQHPNVSINELNILAAAKDHTTGKIRHRKSNKHNGTLPNETLKATLKRRAFNCH